MKDKLIKINGITYVHRTFEDGRIILFKTYDLDEFGHTIFSKGICTSTFYSDLYKVGDKITKYKFEDYELDNSELIKTARKIAKLIGSPFLNGDFKSNGYGGTKNGENLVNLRIDGKVSLTCTCRNCGDGSHVDLNKLIMWITKLAKSKK